MPVDFYATQEHFADHLMSLYRGLSSAMSKRAGGFHVPLRLAEYIRRVHGVEPIVTGRQRMVVAGSKMIAPGDNPVCVASSGDAHRAALYDRPIILVEHGCGLSFSGTQASHSGGGGSRVFCNMFIMPNEYCAKRDRKQYPQAVVAVVGSPKMDKYHAWGIPHSTGNAEPVVCWQTHWNATTAPEAMSAFREFQSAAPELKKRFRLVAHCHPRGRDDFMPIFRRLGIPFIETFEEVLKTCDLMIGDAGSAPYEFAYLDKPVVVCNSVKYRRKVHHGLRFWESIPGIQCDTAAALPDAVATALEDGPTLAAMRRAAIDRTYTPHDGNAAQRAAQAIIAWQDNPPSIQVATRRIVDLRLRRPVIGRVAHHAHA